MTKTKTKPRIKKTKIKTKPNDELECMYWFLQENGLFM